jgi:hypothetical protein
MVPQGFPDTEWDHIIRGDPVDLDVVLSSLHHIAPVKENLGRVGSTQISLGQSDPARKITTSGEWTSAWNATARAITFAFPHRKEELQEYGEYMDSEFSARISSSHRKLFAFDKAVRHHVGGGTNHTPHRPQCLLLLILSLPFARRNRRERFTQHD